jgi:hypothetical protein
LKQFNLKAEYEKDKIAYLQPAKYRGYFPDWKIGPNTYIETKGRFTVYDRQKMLWVIQDNPGIKLYMLFQNAQVTLSKSSKTTYRMWCEKHGIECADISEINIWRKWFNNV